jgi:NhaC family Na+:H+ antiporter
VVLVVVLSLVIKVFKADALTGPSQIALLFAGGISVLIATLFYKIPWKNFEESIAENIKSVSTALILLLLIGAVGGTWMVSGVVPTLIDYGIKIISPRIFLFASCLICAIVSLITGSSWTTIATVGVALIGIGTAQGFTPGWTAGAIISGAYFGDKVSPLSDTTILASSVSGTPMYSHIKYMMISTVPTFVITLLIFLVVGFAHNVSDIGQIEEFCQTMESTFVISPWLMIVPIATGILIARGVSAIPTLFLSTIFAIITAIIVQPDIIWEIANGTSSGYSGSLSLMDGLNGVFTSICSSTHISSGNETVDALISTRGMRGMLDTVFLIICSITFAATLMASGMLQSLTSAILTYLHRTVSTVTTTVFTGIFCNLTTSDQYLSIILTTSIYKPLYEKLGLESRLLSRTTEDSTSVTSVLIPWNSCGMTQSTVLQVPTIEYLPYCFFNLISPLMSILVASVGYKIYRAVK